MDAIKLKEILNSGEKNKFISIPATIVRDYKCGMFYINIDVNYNEFKINEK